jgi:epoxide hydrolase-like predicted phosphatase
VTIRAIILDVGGVLVHENDQTCRAKWEAQLGLRSGELTHIVFGTESAARAAVGQVTESTVWDEVGSRLGLTHEQIGKLRRDFWSSEQLDSVLVHFIQGLRPRYRIGILSNAWSDARSIHNARFKFDDWVDLAVYSAEVKLTKPDPRIYQLALSGLELAGVECIFVDDKLVNVQAALALGMQGVWYRETRQAIDEIAQCLHQPNGT